MGGKPTAAPNPGRERERASVGTEFCKARLFWRAWLLGGAWLLGLPEVALDGKGINTHGHRLAGNLCEALAVRAVLVDAFNHGHGDGAGPIASQAGQFVRLPRQRVQCPELATGVSEQDEEVVGFALLNLLKLHKKRQVTDSARGYVKGKARPKIPTTFENVET